MSWDKATYLSERQYSHKKNENLDQEQIRYWEEVVGKEELQSILSYYKVSLDEIFGQENYTFSEREFEKIDSLEKQYEKWEVIEEKFDDKSKKIIFGNFFTPLIKFTIFCFRKNGRCNAIEESLGENLLKKIVQISSGVLMFEMQLNKKAGKLRGKIQKKNTYIIMKHF